MKCMVICSIATHFKAQFEEILDDKYEKNSFFTSGCEHKKVDSQTISKSATLLSSASYTN